MTEQAAALNKPAAGGAGTSNKARSPQDFSSLAPYVERTIKIPENGIW